MFNRECQSTCLRFSYLSIVLSLGLLLGACGGSTAKFLAKGEEYLQKRKFHDAMMQFRAAAESDSGSAKAHWGLARAYENLGQFNDVVDELRKAVELDDTNLDAKARLGNYYLLVQPPMISETEQLRDQILAADPKFIEGHILSASIMAAQNRPDADVIAQVNKAIDFDPTRIQSYISLQRLYMTRERSADAETAIKRGLAANPQAVQGYTEYGRFLMYANRDKEAEAEFQKGIAVNGGDIEIREALAEFYQTSKQLEKAEATYKELIQVQENSPESWMELADFYDKTGRKDEAVGVLENVLTTSPEYARARYRVGQMYLDQRNTLKVNEQLDALFKVNDKDTEALTLRAKLRMQESKYDEAVKDLEDILKKLPSSREALFLIAQSKISLGQIDQGNAFVADLDRYHPNYLRTGLLKIQAAFATNDSANAVKFSNDLLSKANAVTPNADLDPQAIQDVRVRAMTSRGLANLDLGKTADAKADLQQVAEMSPNSASAMVNLAKVFVVERDMNKALELYEKGLAADRLSFDAMAGIVSTLIASQQPAKAHARVGTLVDANAGKGDVIAALHYLNSTIFAAEKNPQGQETELTTAIQTDSEYLPAYTAYASFLAMQNRGDEAIAQYKKIIEKRPAAQAYTMVGILEEARGNAAAAEKAYRDALEITPESPIAANNLACLIIDSQGNLDEALGLATMAVTKDPNVAGFYDTLGWVYLQKGHVLPAVEQLKKAVALEETAAKKAGTAPDPSYHARLGIALARSGDKVAARREVETSLKFAANLTPREVSEARNVLATL